MKITIVGGGNIGTQFAVHCAQKKHQVTVFTSRPESFSSHLTCVDEHGKIICAGDIRGATADPEKAVADADVIFVTVPADRMPEYARKIIPYIRPGVKIGLIPGTGGGECIFRSCMEKGAVIFGLQRVPAVARLVKYGARVRSIGYRPQLFAAALPKRYTQECCQILSDIFNIPCAALPDYLNLTLTPSNPVLHTTRLRILFGDYTPGLVYDSIPLFYQQWNDESSRLLIACDEEVQQICRSLDAFDLSGVRSLKLHYESDTPEKMTRKISSIPAFQGLVSPQKAVEGGAVPDFNSRYFTADFSYGLAILVQIARMVDIPVPNMEQTLQWYQSIAGQPEIFRFSLWGIGSLEDFIAFYSQ